MSEKILSNQELAAFWKTALHASRDVPPEDKIVAFRTTAWQIFPEERKPDEIADRFYALMMCLDSSADDLGFGGVATYGEDWFEVKKEVVEKLWDHFGDRDIGVSLDRPIRASQILR